MFVCSHTVESTRRLPNTPVANRTTKRMRKKDAVQPDRDSTSSENIDSGSDVEAPPVRSRKKSANYQPTWCKKDLKEVEGKTKFPWKNPPAALKAHLSPVSLFESIFTHELMEHIYKESNGYATQKGMQNFDLDIPTLKLFLSILMLSGYVPLPHRSMYWEAQGDAHNSMVSGAMPRNKFSFIMECAVGYYCFRNLFTIYTTQSWQTKTLVSTCS